MGKKPSEGDMQNFLSACYGKCLTGFSMSKPVEEMARDYMDRYPSVSIACDAMIRKQNIKCMADGFVTSFGGFASMLVTLPANVTSVLYMQMRMIACVAYMGGYDLNSDQVQTFVYACLAGIGLSNVLSSIGVKIGTKLTKSLISKIPGKTLIAINKKVGFRLLTKFGTKGAINFGRLIPIVGGVVGGGVDLITTKIIANRAKKWFLEGSFDYSVEEDGGEEPIEASVE